MRKVLSIALIAIICFSLLSCHQAPNTSKSASDSSQAVGSSSNSEVKKNNIRPVGFIDQVVVQKFGAKGESYNKTIRNQKNVENILKSLDKLTYSGYEQAQSFGETLTISVYHKGIATRYEVYDNRWIIKDDGLAKKLSGDGSKALTKQIDAMANEYEDGEKIDLKKQEIGDCAIEIKYLIDEDIKKIKKDMTYKQIMLTLGYGRYSESSYQKWYECEVSVAVSSTPNSITSEIETTKERLQFYFDSLDEKIGLDGTEIISNVLNKKRVFYSSNTAREVPYESYLNGEYLVYYTTLYDGRYVLRLYDRNMRRVLKDDYSDIKVYDKDCITTTSKLFNSKGESLLQFECVSIYFVKSAINGELMGIASYNNGYDSILVDKSGKKLTNTVYEGIFYNPDDTFQASLNGKWFTIDKHGKVLSNGKTLIVSEIKNGVRKYYNILNQNKAKEFTEMMSKLKTGATASNVLGILDSALQKNYTFEFNGDYVYCKNKYMSSIPDYSEGYRNDISKIFTSSVNIEEKISQWLQANKKYILITQAEK